MNLLEELSNLRKKGQIYSEKSEKVYLSSPLLAPIFVSELINKVIYFLTGKIKIVITLILVAGSITVNWGQTFLWPGDVSNNGIVNQVDLLYWALVAEDNQISGPRRSNQTTDFQEVLIDSLWETSFPDSLNHAYADCNGDGKIDKKDYDVIIANFEMQRAEIEPDTFFTGIENIHPPLVAEVETEEVRQGQEAKVLFSLGSEDIPVDSFFAIVLTIPYGEDVDTREIENAKFDLQDSWMGRANADLRVEIFNDLDNMRTHVLISRKRQRGMVIRQESFEPVGEYSIVMEDIALDRSISIEPTNTKMISSSLIETKVYTSGTDFMYKTDETTSTYDPRLAEQKVLIYPNPTTEGIVHLSTEGRYNSIQAFELYNLLGRRVQRRALDSPASRLRLNVGDLSTGLYLLKVKTTSGFYTGKLKIQQF